MYPIFLLLLDGLGDRAHEVLGGRTGNEAAQTPNLDRFCASGSCGVIYAVGPGRAPSSEVAHWSMLGYRPDEFPGRAVFEALGRGQEVSDEHVFAYAALQPAERKEDGWWLTGRPDPERDAEEAQRLIERCNGIEVDGLAFSLEHVWRGEAVLRLEGERFNVITLKWFGRPRPVSSFLERHGLHGTFVAASAFLRGLAIAVGLGALAAPETEDVAGDLASRLELARE